MLGWAMNLHFAGSGFVPPPVTGQSPRASRYRVGARATDVNVLFWAAVVWQLL